VNARHDHRGRQSHHHSPMGLLVFLPGIMSESTCMFVLNRSPAARVLCYTPAAKPLVLLTDLARCSSALLLFP